ncbi:MAG: phosphatase PAP2 family protein [Thermoanaerobaculia bacterium]
MRRLLFVFLAAALFSTPTRAAFGQQSPCPASEDGDAVTDETAPPAPETPEPASPSRPSLPKRVFLRAKEELGRYVADAAGIATAPARWDAKDWKTAAGATVILGGLFAADESIDHAAKKNRSRFTDKVSSATTSLGGGRGPQISVALIAAGIVFDDPNVRDMGREAIEAGLFTSLLNNLIVKRAFGRERPYRSNGETDFDFGSNNSSFPSGHATEAFSVASVVAMRAPGWIIPGLAYAAATFVAFDRVNDRVHFSSDVFAGAVLGTVTGRWLVARHRREQKKGAPKASLDIVPIRNGLSARVRF